MRGCRKEAKALKTLATKLSLHERADRGRTNYPAWGEIWYVAGIIRTCCTRDGSLCRIARLVSSGNKDKDAFVEKKLAELFPEGK
jgi:hypothetical protein